MIARSSSPFLPLSEIAEDRYAEMWQQTCAQEWTASLRPNDGDSIAWRVNSVLALGAVRDGAAILLQVRACLGLLLFVSLLDCGISKPPDIPCVSYHDCPSDLSYCDGTMIECSQQTYAVIGGVCRKDQYSQMNNQACAVDSDCQSVGLGCAICSPGLDCPTCQFPVPGCAIGPGSCGEIICFSSSAPYSCAPPCQIGGRCNNLYLYKDKCPDLVDGGMDDTITDSGVDAVVDSDNAE